MLPKKSPAILIAIIAEAINRPFNEIDRFFFQSCSAGPNHLEFSSLCCSSGDDRAKKKHASKANGVLGSTGRGTPAIARAKEV